MAVAAARLWASATVIATSATVAPASTAAAIATAAEVFRRGLAGVIGAFAVEGMLHLGGHGLVEEALDASQQSAVLGTAE